MKEPKDLSLHDARELSRLMDEIVRQSAVYQFDWLDMKTFYAYKAITDGIIKAEQDKIKAVFRNVVEKLTGESRDEL